MAQLFMYDDITASALPSGADAYAGYVDGRYNDYAAIKARFPNAHVVSIAVFASDDADCLDVEPTDATIAEVYGWLKRQLARGVWRPIIYTSASNVDALMRTMNANGFSRSQYRLWSAHYGGGQHICGPATCKLTATACDGTQFTDNALGRSLDESVLLDSFFQPAPVSNWCYGMPHNLRARGGRTSVFLQWSPPSGSIPANASGYHAPSGYEVCIYRPDGSLVWQRHATTTSFQGGSLPKGNYQAHVYADGAPLPSDKHYVAVNFSTSG
jgi:hypothetical protein